MALLPTDLRAVHRDRMNINQKVAALASTMDGRGTVEWMNPKSKVEGAPASAKLLEKELYLSAPIRQGNRYPGQRNYHGLYFFSQTTRHIWVESKLEASSLASLDMSHSIAAIASQPMRLQFTDGQIHFPDFLALHANQRQVLYDVKPKSRIDEKVLTQFARTKALCDLVGWGYDVLTELEPVPQANLEWLRNFKHAGFYPANDALEDLLSKLTTPMTVRNAAVVLGKGSIPQGRSALFHLLWNGDITTNLSIRLTDTSLVERTSK
ncbi:MAG: TnsA-like heteromeric transposase endonuclease subunit [Rhodoglobus sp.]